MSQANAKKANIEWVGNYKKGLIMPYHIGPKTKPWNILFFIKICHTIIITKHAISVKLVK